MLFPTPALLIVALCSLITARADITGPLPFGTSTDPWKARHVPKTTQQQPDAPSFSPAGLVEVTGVDAAAFAKMTAKTTTKTKKVVTSDDLTTITSTSMTVMSGSTSIAVVTTIKSKSEGALGLCPLPHHYMVRVMCLSGGQASFKVDRMLLPVAVALDGLIAGATAIF
ncbi:hypothetical protein IAR50_002378 [Cryptococcus sp. DSM 104548]